MDSRIFEIRPLENIHILLWLLKDTCWLLEFKVGGVIMVVPTVLMAVIIAWRTHQIAESWLNWAVLCWILANSYWMFSEFFMNEQHKIWALIPFMLGLVFCTIYFLYAKKATDKKS